MKKIDINKIPVQVRATIAYTISSLLSQGLIFLTTPIFTRIMNTSEMGTVTTFNAWNGILINIVTLSLCSGAFNIAMLEYSDKRDRYVASMLGLSTVSTVLFGIIYFMFYKQWNSVFTLSTPLMIVMFLGFLINPGKDLWMARKRYEYKYKEFLIVSVVTSVLAVFVSVVAVFGISKLNRYDLGSVRVVFNGITVCLASLPIYIYVFYKGKCFYDKKFWKYAIVINTPLIIHALSKHILDMSDRLMISNMCGKSQVGIYGVLYTVSSLSIIVWNAINQSLVPYIFQCMKNKDIQKIRKITISILVLYGGCSVGLSLIAPEIVRILATEEYFEAIYIMPPIAAGIFLTSIYSLFSTVTLYYKKTNYIMYATLFSAISNVLLNFIFIKKYGYMAAAYTTLVAYIILTIFQYIYMCKCTNEKIYNTGKIVVLSMIVIALNLVCIFLYKSYFARYCVISVMILIVGFKHKKIIKIINDLRNK